MFGVIGVDKPLGKFLVGIMDLLVLNLWFLLYSLPLVTIGAATAALYQVAIAMADKRSEHVGAEFRAAFKENFKSITPIWMVELFILLFIGMDVYLNWLGLLGSYKQVFYIVFAAALAVLLSYADWVAAITARFVNVRKAVTKNASMFLVKFHLISLALTAACFLFTAFVFTEPYFWPVAVWLGFSFPAWVKGKFFAKVFAPYVEEIQNKI